MVASRGATSAMSADQLLGSVRKACADADGLEKFWDDCQAKLKSLPAELLEDSITSAAEVRQPAG